MIKLAIICGIFAVGAFMFLPQTLDVSLDIPPIFDSIKDQAGDIASDALVQVEKGLDSSIDLANSQLDGIKESSGNLLR